MNDDQSAKDAARAHWLVTGVFSPRPAGRRFVVTRDGFDQALQEAGLDVEVTVADRLGADTSRKYTFSFSSLRSFTLKSIVQSVEPLARLSALQMRLAKPSERPGLQEVLAELESTVGKGVLYASIAGEQTDTSNRPLSQPRERGGDAVDAIFEQAEVGVDQEPKSAIDHFVRATGSKNRSSASDAKFFQRAATYIEEAVYTTAADIARSRAASELESSWRGLKFLVDQTPPGKDICIETVDIAPDELSEVLQACLEEQPFDRPDAVFALTPVATLDQLASIADTAEQLSLPCVVSADTALFGISDVNATSENRVVSTNESWKTLRQNPSFRWLCVASNPVAVFSEGAGQAKRTVFASPAVAIAAAMTASYRDRGTFAKVTGPEGKLRAPTTRTIPHGRFSGVAAPTQDFYTIDTQRQLAALGIVGFGSSRHSDQLLLTAIPTAYGGPDGVPLPAQLLTGRVVRFAEFVAGELSSDSADQEVADTFASASQALLFPAMDRVAKLAARAVHEHETSWVEVEVKASAQVAMIPFEISFRLPLGSNAPATA